MRKSTLWGLTLATVIGSGAVAATSMAPAFSSVTRADEAISYTLNPESGAAVENLQTIMLSFPDIKGVQFTENFDNSIVLTNTTTGAVYICYGPMRDTFAMGGSAYILNFIPEGEWDAVPINEAGSYTLQIKEGAFFYGEEDENGVVADPIKTPAINATYSIGGAAYTTYPLPGSTVADLTQIELNFPAISGVEYMENYANSVVLENKTSGTVYTLAGADLDTRSTNPGTTYVLNFKKEGEEDVTKVNEPGDYELIVKEGAFVEVVKEATETEEAEYKKLEGFTLSYTIDGVAFNLSPEAGVVTDLQQITVNFPDVDDMQYQENYAASVVLVNETTGTEYLLAGDPDRDYRSMTTGTTYTMHFVKAGEQDVVAINEPGHYSLLIKEGAFYYGEDQTKVQEITASYSISGVEYTLTPSNAAPATDLQEITINFPTITGVEYMENYVNSITLTYMNSEEEDGNVSYVLAGADLDTRSTNPGTTYTLHFVKEGDENVVPIINPGKYVLLIKEGAFVYSSEAEESEEASAPNKIQEISAVYTIDGVDFELTPANGNVVEDLSSIFINFPSLNDVEFMENYTNSIVLENTTTGSVYNLLGADRQSFSTNPGTTFNMIFAAEGEDAVAPIVEPGEYRLLIKDGAYIYNDGRDKIQKILAYYTISGIDYVLSPLAGSYVDDLAQIQLNFDKKGVELMENYLNSVTLTNETTGTTYTLAGADRNTRLPGSAFTLNFVKAGEEEVAPITEPGKYTLLIKEGAFVYTDEVENAEEAEEGAEPVYNKVQQIKASYTIEGVAYILDPESGATVEDLSKINITFPDYKGMNIIDYYPNGILLENLTTGSVYTLAGADLNTFAETAGTCYTLNFIAEGEEDMAPITEAGKYQLTIKNGVFYYGDDPTVADKVPAITADYTIQGVEYKLSPAAGSVVEDLSVISINFLVDTDVEYIAGNPKAILLQNTTTGEVYTLAGDPLQIGHTTNKGITFELRFLADGEEDAAVIKAEGNYLLTIANGAFVAGEEKVPAIEATYTIDGTTGVSEIFGADETIYNVYNVNGVQILKNADKDAVNALPNGLYIINGKKVIVK